MTAGCVACTGTHSKTAGHHRDERSHAFFILLFPSPARLPSQPRKIMVENVITDLADGTVLANLLEILTGAFYVSWHPARWLILSAPRANLLFLLCASSSGFGPAHDAVPEVTP
jgi:hypothetical protein